MTSSKLVLHQVDKLQRAQLVALALAFACIAAMAVTSGGVGLVFTIAWVSLLALDVVLAIVVEVLLHRLRQSWTRRPR